MPATAYRDRCEFRISCRGSKTREMQAAEARIGMELRLFIVTRSAEGWPVDRIAKALACTPRTLAHLWCPRLGLHIQKVNRIVPG